MGWRIYGELEPEDSFITEFLIGALWGMLSVYGYGLIFVWAGWLSQSSLSIAGIGTGLVSGTYCGSCLICSSKKKTIQHNVEEPHETNGRSDE